MRLERRELERIIRRCGHGVALPQADIETVVKATRTRRRIARGSFQHETTGCRCPVALAWSDFETACAEVPERGSFAMRFDQETNYAARAQRREHGWNTSLIEVTE